MKAVKANKVYTIEEKEKKRYIEQGFDILDDEGGIIEYGRGKTVPYAEHEALKKELEAVKAECEASANQKDDPEVVNILAKYAAEHDIEIGQSKTVSGIMKKITEAAGGDQ